MASRCRHKNNTVNFLFNMCSSLDMLVMARNLRFVCNKYGIKPRDVINCSPSYISKLVKENYYKTVLESDQLIGVQIMELIHIRDEFCEDFSLNRTYICDIIEYLATN